MAVMVALKHILRDTNGSLRYKRRVPKSIQPLFGGKQHFIKVLGRTEAEALVSYGPYHKHVETLTLLHHTGARLGEIAGLAMADIVLDTETPHIVIEPKPWRRIKNRWSERKVPLIGEALSVAHKIKDQRGRYDHVFPRYIRGRGADRLSYDLMRHLKQVRENDKQVLHSLRHTMKDALRNAGVSHELACAILGHELSKGIDKEYGTGFYLRLMEDALLKVFPPV